MALGENIKRDKLIPDNDSNGHGHNNGNGHDNGEKNGIAGYADCQSIFNGFPNPIIVADSNGVINFANRASESFWRNDLIGKKADGLIDAEAQQVVKSDGSIVPAIISESHAHPNGDLTFTYFIDLQASDKQQIPAKYQKQVHQLALVADNTDNAIIITSPKGEIEYVNKGFTKITGYSEEEVMGKKLVRFYKGKIQTQRLWKESETSYLRKYLSMRKF